MGEMTSGILVKGDSQGRVGGGEEDTQGEMAMV